MIGVLDSGGAEVVAGYVPYVADNVGRVVGVTAVGDGHRRGATLEAAQSDDRVGHTVGDRHAVAIPRSGGDRRHGRNGSARRRWPSRSPRLPAPLFKPTALDRQRERRGGCR